MRFYSMQPSELFNLEEITVNQIFQAIPILEAQEQLVNLKNQDFPTMKNEARRKLFKHLNKIAYPVKIKESKKSLSIDDIAKILNGV